MDFHHSWATLSKGIERWLVNDVQTTSMGSCHFLACVCRHSSDIPQWKLVSVGYKDPIGGTVHR
ncbi:hypothetical protein PAXRUDRAFT_779305, partial [Paxillus rubicundulus Ve08.2h10]